MHEPQGLAERPPSVQVPDLPVLSKASLLDLEELLGARHQTAGIFRPVSTDALGLVGRLEMRSGRLLLPCSSPDLLLLRISGRGEVSWFSSTTTDTEESSLDSPLAGLSVSLLASSSLSASSSWVSCMSVNSRQAS